MAPPHSAFAIIVEQFSVGDFGPQKRAPIHITNDDLVTYDSLKFDSSLADALWNLHGVQDLFNNDFSDFTSSGLFGYTISSGSPVGSGWSSSVQNDGTIMLNHVGGDAGVDYDAFSDGQTMTGNKFFHESLLDSDGDGLPNYSFDFSSQFSPEQLSLPLSVSTSFGNNNSGNFLEAYTTDVGPPLTSSGELQYSFVPTADHPAIPEPKTFALVASFIAMGSVLMRKRRRARAQN